MTPPTTFYADMKASLREAENLVAKVDQIECKTDLQHLKLQGYILISHSIFEVYLEQLGKATALNAKRVFEDDDKITTTLVALISTSVAAKISGKAKQKVSAELAGNLEIFTKAAVSNYVDSIRRNNGITTNDQKNLFLPLGVDLETLDMPLSQNLNILARKRGALAHSFKVQREETLSAVQSRINDIVTGLKTLDDRACEVCTA